MAARFAQEEEGGLGVDRRHLVVLGFADLGEGLLQHFADGVDGNVGSAHGGDGVGEQLLDGGGGGQVRLQCDGLCAGRLDRGNGRIRFGFGRGAVVVDRHGAGALLRQVARDQPAQVLGAAGDQYDFALDGMVCHGKTPS
ncbi:hypothetical protein D3C71_1806510 [compost metagenome]